MRPSAIDLRYKKHIAPLPEALPPLAAGIIIGGSVESSQLGVWLRLNRIPSRPILRAAKGVGATAPRNERHRAQSCAHLMTRKLSVHMQIRGDATRLFASLLRVPIVAKELWNPRGSCMKTKRIVRNESVGTFGFRWKITRDLSASRRCKKQEPFSEPAALSYHGQMTTAVCLRPSSNSRRLHPP
jgi:hypothetical protein